MGSNDLSLPPYRGHNVKVSVINGAKSHMAAKLLVHPAPAGEKHLKMATYSFLIESDNKNQKLLFDLAFMKDLDNKMPPAAKALFAGGEDLMGIDEVHDIPDTIKAQGIDLAAINAIVWSHAHLDHIGDPSVFPPSTDLIVGPGFKNALMPGYPTNPDSLLFDSAFQNRRVRELDFNNIGDDAGTTTIGGFRAIDYFGDSSLYLLEAPGHTAHHICALCRTTPDSWVLLAGDACHNVAQLRPNSHRPLPDNVPASVLGRTPPPSTCSCAHLAPLLKRTKTGALYDLAPGMHDNLDHAEDTVEKIKAFEGRDDFFVIIAHDASLLDVLDFFPSHINEWKAKDWANQSRWLFLNEVEEETAGSS